MIFRFDDVCINSDMELHNRMTDFLLKKFKCEVIWAVSVGVIGKEGQRVFPKAYNAVSDHKHFYYLDKVGVPKLRKDITIATHGLFHVDHRLLTKEVQEVSIITSVSLIETYHNGVSTFVPPFNKWNQDTVSICSENNFTLIKYEDDWKSMEYNTYNPSKEKYYLHAREWTFDKFKKYFS